MRVTGVKIESSKTIHTVIIYIRHLNYLGPKLALACSERLWLLVVPWRGALGLGGSGAQPLVKLRCNFWGAQPSQPIFNKPVYIWFSDFLARTQSIFLCP